MAITKARPARPQGDTTVFNATPGLTPGTGQVPAGSAPATLVSAASWSLPSLAAGANATLDVATPGIHPGDLASVAFPGTPVPDGVAITTFCGTDKVTLNARNNGASASPGTTLAVIVEAMSAGQVAAEEAVAWKSR